MAAFIKVILKYCILIFFGIIIGILFLEIGVRLLGAKPETYLRKFSQYHPILGWVKTPNMEGEFRRGDVRIHEKMNNRGLRDIDYDYGKPKNTLRILVLGDSFTEGYDVDFTNIFTEILERKLNTAHSPRTGIRYEVINAGTGGYSTDQEYLFYMIEGFRYEPDIVLMMTYAANDIYYNTEYRYGNYFKPLFAVTDDSLYLTNTPLPEPKQQESVKDIFRNMALYPIIIKTVLTQLPSMTNFLSRWGFISQSTLETSNVYSNDSLTKKYPSSFSIFAKEQTEKVTESWKVTECMIRNLNNAGKSNGSSFVLFSIPDRFQVYPESWAATKARYNVNENVWDPELPNRKLDSIASKYNIPFLDFSAYLATGNKIREPLYNGVHWNEKGNEIAAEFIYQELIKKGLIKN